MADMTKNANANTQIEAIKEKCDRIKPLVVIRCITYNHEPYIKNALEGFIMQETDFPFVAIVHDDASTDGTARIIKEYAEKYPYIILPIFEEENQYSKGREYLAEIMDTACLVSRAKYIALCEGDDYWINPNKLQLQIDLMQKDSSISLSFHSILEKYENSSIKSRIRKSIEDREYSGEEWFSTRPAQTASFVLKSDILKSDLYKQIINNKDFVVGDIPLLLVCAHYGKLYGLPDVMSVYRHNSGGWTSMSKSVDDQWKVIRMQDAYCLFGEEYRSITKQLKQRDCLGFFISNLKKGKIYPKFLYESLKISVSGTFKSFFKILRRRYV